MTQPSRSKVSRALLKGGHAQSVGRGRDKTPGFTIQALPDRDYVRVFQHVPVSFSAYSEQAIEERPSRLEAYADTLVAAGFTVHSTGTSLTVRKP